MIIHECSDTCTITCVFSHSGLARRECAEVIDYTSENYREQRLSQFVLAHMSSNSPNQHCQFVTAWGIFCEIWPNLILSSWLGLLLLSIRK